MMQHKKLLDDLQKRNDSLKAELTKKQIRHDNYTFKYYEKYSKLIINEYKKHKSLFKSAMNVGINQQDVLNWYTQGQLGNPKFRPFYLLINKINKEDNVDEKSEKPTISPDEMPEEGEYEISQYGDGWSYKTFINGEKIFIISDELETLKSKIKSRHLPMD